MAQRKPGGGRKTVADPIKSRTICLRKSEWDDLDKWGIRPADVLTAHLTARRLAQGNTEPVNNKAYEI